MSVLERRGLECISSEINGCKLSLFIARSFSQRALGLIGTDELTPREGLWIARCNSIHTLGMRYSIDVVFMSPSRTVLKVETMKPNKIYWHAAAASVLELVEGNSKNLGLLEGSSCKHIPLMV